MTLYSWGLGKNGELGNGKKVTEHTPHHITKNSNGKTLGLIKGLDCGALFTAVITDDGFLLSTGCGKYGRLGQGQGDKDSIMFTSVKDLSAVKQVSCGSWHAAAVSEAGQLYIWGYSKVYIDLQSQADCSIPVPVSIPNSHRIQGVSCGHNYTFAWTEEGQVLSWGKAQNGVLGHGMDSDVPTPKLIEKLSVQTIVYVGAGHSHCGIVTQDGQLYMTGKGSDGALGLGPSNLSNANIPTRVNTKEKIISAVSCSKGEHHGHTLAITADGQVLAWGDGYKGKLGFGNQESVFTPAAIDSEHFNKETVVSICAGGIHSAAATANGGVYTWGCGSDGRLGHPEGQGHRYLFRSDVPKLVESLHKNPSRPAFVSCAYYHTAAVL